MKEKKLVLKLIERGYKISTAESCTGGMLASRIVNVPMASKVFDEAFVTYANDAKIKYLDVKQEIIDRVGVVSEEVVLQMASGLANVSKADICIAISGIAGPSGGTKETPVGTVCFGFYINGNVSSVKKHFKGSRIKVRKKSTAFAIDTVLNLLN